MLAEAKNLAEQLKVQYEGAYQKQYEAQIEIANMAGDEIAKKQEERDKNEQAQWERMTEGKMDDLKKMNDQAAAFGDLFAENLIQAADYGFDSVLKSWALALEQMVLKTAAANLFKSLF